MPAAPQALGAPFVNHVWGGDDSDKHPLKIIIIIDFMNFRFLSEHVWASYLKLVKNTKGNS